MNELVLNILSKRAALKDKPDAQGQAFTNSMIIAGTQYFGKQGGANLRQLPVVVVVYNDIHAAQRAAEAVEQLVPKFSDQGCEQILPVPVEQLDDPGHFDRLLSYANSADMIIVSYNGVDDFPDPLKKWIVKFLLQQKQGHAAVIALLGANEKLDAPDSPRYQFFKNAAWAAGLAFIPPAG